MLASETGIESVTPSISFSQFCLEKLHEVIDGHTNDVAGLRLQIMRRTPEGFQHVLSMVEDGAQDKIPDDLVVSIENIKVYVPIKDAKYLDGLISKCQSQRYHFSLIRRCPTISFLCSSLTLHPLGHNPMYYLRLHIFRRFGK